MPMIEICANGVLIGHVTLAGIDDGMGVGCGSFPRKNEGVKARETRVSGLRFSVSGGFSWERRVGKYAFTTLHQ